MILLLNFRWVLGVQIYHCLEKFTFFQKGEAILYKISVCTVFGDNPQKIKFEKKLFSCSELIWKSENYENFGGLSLEELEAFLFTGGNIFLLCTIGFVKVSDAS